MNLNVCKMLQKGVCYILTTVCVSYSINNIKSETMKCNIYLLPESNIRPKSEFLILKLSVTCAQLPNSCNDNQMFHITQTLALQVLCTPPLPLQF